MWKKLLLIFLIIVGIIAYGVFWAFFDMGKLQEGEYIAEETSPGGRYTVKAYVTNGGTTTSYAVRGELNFNQEKRKPKNIYWQYRIDTASIKWLDHDTVIINNVELDVPNDTYDFRRELWMELSESKGVLRIWQNREITFVNVNHFDSLIITTTQKLHVEQAQKSFLLSARIIGEVLGQIEQSIFDAFLEYRIRELVYNEVFEIKGIPKDMRSYSVRLR